MKQSYVLCGGTFFVLLVDAMKRSSSICKQRKEFAEITESNLLEALAKIYNPDFERYLESEKRILKNNTNQFKSCKNWGGTHFEFEQKKLKNAFHNRVINHYTECLSSMTGLTYHFLDISKKSDVLIKALLEVVLADETIKEEQLFYINPDGSPITKAELRNVSEITFQSFLLGIWHYVLVVPENTLGKATYEDWCPQTGNEHSLRKYNKEIGEKSKLSIQVTLLPEITEKNSSADSDTVSTPEESIFEKINRLLQKNTLSLHDADMLQDFIDEWSETIEACIDTDFSMPGFNSVELRDNLRLLCTGNWRYRIRRFKDSELKAMISEIVEILCQLLEYLSDKYMRTVGMNLIPKNESWEEGETLRNVLQPETEELRKKLSDYYNELLRYYPYC